MARRTSTKTDPTRPRQFCEALESRVLLAHSTPWGAFPQLIEQPGALAAYPDITGAGESIAILDTGVDYNLPQLGGGFGPGHKVVGGWNFVDDNADPIDTDGHGTANATLMAGGAYFLNGQRYQGIAPDANIIALKIDDGVNDPPEARIGEALQWVQHRFGQHLGGQRTLHEQDGAVGVWGEVEGAVARRRAGGGVRRQ
jgi:subtilisin family serine protease